MNFKHYKLFYLNFKLNFKQVNLEHELESKVSFGHNWSIYWMWTRQTDEVKEICIDFICKKDRGNLSWED